jgi:hypothetical protein
VDNEGQMAALKPCMGIAFGLPNAFVPHHDGAAAIFALGNCPLEGAVRKGMILCPYRQPFVGGIEARTLRDGPAQQDAVEFQPEIIMKQRGVVFLDEVRQSVLAGLDPPGRRLGCLLKIAFAAVLFQRHVIPRYSRR